MDREGGETFRRAHHAHHRAQGPHIRRTPMLRNALTLAKKGLRVFPCLERDKRPATLHGVNDATINPDMIRRWWQQNPRFNIGIATGAPSNIFVLDVDGIDAESELRK